jgi:hypothetical protein
VLESDGITEEHGASDLEKEEMDDDGHQPLTGISKRSTVMKDRTMSMDSEASVYPEQQIVGRATILAAYTGKPFESDSTTLTAATHLLGVIVWFLVLCGRRRDCISCFVEIVVDGVHTCRWRRFADAGQWRACVTCTSA